MVASNTCSKFVFFLICAIHRITAEHSGTPCATVHQGLNINCVCNATYCDTINIPTDLDEKKLYIYTSCEAGTRFDLSTADLKSKDDSKGTDVEFNISTKNPAHEILGLGGALTDAAAINIASLSKPAQENLLSSYFSKDGLEYTFVRVPIGGSDFSSRKYTYLDVKDSAEPVCLERDLKLQPEDQDLKIPLVQRIVEMSPRQVKLVSSAWYAPDYMLTSDSTHREFVDPIYFRDWAEYHRMFLDLYKERNITFWGCTTGNEIQTGIVSLMWPIKNHQTWINEHLGPVLEQAGYGDLKLLMLDDSAPYMPLWQKLLEDATTNQYIDGVAKHWYLDKWLNLFHGLFRLSFPNKILLSTEACYCQYEPDYEEKTGWDKAEGYALNIIDNFRYYTNGWIDWNMAVDLIGGPNHIRNYCDAPIRVNAEADEFYKQPMFYAMGHFSKFVTPGSKFTETKIHHKNLKAIAFTVSGEPWKTAAVIVNTGNDQLVVNVCMDGEECARVTSPPKSIISAIAA